MSDVSRASFRVIKKRPFSSVPDDVLQDARLSLAARAVLAWAIGRPPEWEIHVWHLQLSLSVSDSQWRRIRKELIQHYYLFQRRFKVKAGELDRDGKKIGGKWRWEIFVLDTPDENFDLSFTTDRNPIHPNPQINHSSVHQDKLTKKQHAPESPKFAAASRPENKKSRRRGDEEVRYGVEIWTSGDEEGLAELVARHGSERVQDVANTITPAPGHRAPFLSAVSVALLKLCETETRQKAMEAKKRDELPPSSPEAALRGLMAAKEAMRGRAPPYPFGVPADSFPPLVDLDRPAPNSS